MVNLLPPLEKKKLERERHSRLAVVVLGAVLGLEVLSSILFSPSFHSLFVNVKDLTVRLEQQKQMIPEEERSIEEILNSMKQEIALLKPTEETKDIPPSLLLEQVLEKKPRGILMRSFAYGHTNAGVTIQISGKSDTRENLLTFQRNIDEDPKVVEVKFDQSFITQKTDIEFRLTVTFK